MDACILASLQAKDARIAELTRQRDELLKVSKNAASAIVAIYEWLDRVEQAGGAKSISGVAACHAMLTSLRKNGNRTETLILAPLRAAIASMEGK